MSNSRWRLVRVVAFSCSYLWWFLRANGVVTREILTPGQGVTPAVVELPLRSRTPAEIATFMGLVTLTPGTMVLALSDDRTRVTVHGMHAGEPHAFRIELSDLEDRMLSAWRRSIPSPRDAGGPSDAEVV